MLMQLAIEGFCSARSETERVTMMTRTLAALHAYVAAVASVSVSSVSAAPTSAHRRADLSSYLLAPYSLPHVGPPIPSIGPGAPGVDLVPASPASLSEVK